MPMLGDHLREVFAAEPANANLLATIPIFLVDDGADVGIANRPEELQRLRAEILGTEAEPWAGPVTGPGWHDEQLSVEMCVDGDGDYYY